MEWAFWILVLAILGLYIWSHVSAGHRIGKKLQPFVDGLFGVTPQAKTIKSDPPAKPKVN